MEAALRARLIANAGVSALVGNRIDWGARPQGSILPAIVLTLVSDERTQHMAGFDSYRATRVQIDCYATTYATAVAMREAVLAAAIPAGSASGVTFRRAFVNTSAGRTENNETAILHRQMLDLTFWHN